MGHSTHVPCTHHWTLMYHFPPEEFKSTFWAYCANIWKFFQKNWGKLLKIVEILIFQENLSRMYERILKVSLHLFFFLIYTAFSYSAAATLGRFLFAHCWAYTYTSFFPCLQSGALLFHMGSISFLYAFISFTFQGWIRYRSFCSGRTLGALVKTVKYSKFRIILGSASKNYQIFEILNHSCYSSM